MSLRFKCSLVFAALAGFFSLPALADDAISPTPPTTAAGTEQASYTPAIAAATESSTNRYVSVFQSALASNGTGVYFDVGWINWRARKDSTPFAAIATPVGGAVGGIPLDPDSYTSQGYDTNFGRDNGMRIGTGYKFESGWDVGATFTSFRSDGAKSIGDPTQDTDRVLAFRMDRVLGENASLNGDFDATVADSASEELRIKNQTVDLELGRAFKFLGSSATVRPFAGLRYTELVQQGRIVYQNLENGDDLDSYTIDENSSMSAWGLRLGSDLAWNFGESGFSVFGRGGISLLLADIRVSRRDLAFNQSQGDYEQVEFKQKEHGVVPVAEAALGVAYARGPFYISAGYEFLNFFNALRQVNQEGWSVQPRISKSDTTASSISFDGFFLNTGFTY